MGKNAGAAVPQPGAFTADDEALLSAARSILAAVRKHVGEQGFHHALDAIWAVVGAANRYVDVQAPWTLRKTDPARMATVLYVLAETIRRLATIVQPVMPDTMARLLDQLAVPADNRDFAAFDTPLAPGVRLPAPTV